MRESHFLSSSLTTQKDIGDIEQLDESFCDLGRSIEYRQLERGRLSCRFTALEGEGWFLLGEESNRYLEA